ncbi:MAG: hypothetical protein WD894_19855 [Pirellulales bacterium]
MTTDELSRVHQAQPFQRFTMYLADGRKLYVPHPEFLSRHPKGRTVIVFHEDGLFSIVDSFRITEIEFHTGKAHPGQNGAKKRKKP